VVSAIATGLQVRDTRNARGCANYRNPSTKSGRRHFDDEPPALGIVRGSRISEGQTGFGFCVPDGEGIIVRDVNWSAREGRRESRRP